MTEQEFLEHHGLERNPFADEDAQTDALFRDRCIDVSRHPAWSKVFGDPAHPSTAIVLGPKGSGKTAMRLQMVRQLEEHNRESPEQRIFIVQYDDFNRYLGPFQQHFSARAQANPEKVLASLQVWDHIDAILSEVTTQLVDETIAPKTSATPNWASVSNEQIAQWDRAQRRDLLLLSACYDQSLKGSFTIRQRQLRQKLRFVNLGSWLWLSVGFLGSAIAMLLSFLLLKSEAVSSKSGLVIALFGLLGAWTPYLISYARHLYSAWRIVKQIRIGRRDVRSLCRVLMQIPSHELAGQPLPVARTSDSRYAMLDKMQSLLRTIGFKGLIVLVDRVDEPEIVNGRAERMRGLVWPLLDNKLLKHPGLGLKLLLPDDLQYFLDRETREFHERARLDKQNVIGNFDWTGEALFDVAVARMRACSGKNTVSPIDLLDSKISEVRLLAAMQSLRTPRNLFRFLYRLVSEHCKRYRSTEPAYKISSENFEATLAVFQNELMRSASIS